MFLADIFWPGLGWLAGGVVLAWTFFLWRRRFEEKSGRASQKNIIEMAQREADTLKREARLAANEEAYKLRDQVEQSFAQRRKEISELEQRLGQREILINAQLEGLVQDEKNLRSQQKELTKKCEALALQQQEIEQLQADHRQKLQHIGRLTESEARALLMKEVQDQAMQEAAQLTRRIVEEAKSRAEEKARHIISIAIQRYAGEHTFETSTATVALHGDDIKGRIIGREGRNIRAFEAATGTTVLIDDTPNAVVLSGFDPVRREIAREAMERLILDGRIHPTRIEEVVAKVNEEMEETIIRVGEEAVTKVGLPPMHLDLVKLLGRLRFRHSFSQNILAHSVEVAHLMGLMAAELGIDVAAAKRAGLLHDIGKAVSHEIEGAHAIVGADILKRLGESDPVVNGVASHHDEVPHVGPLGILVSAADAISASRPGARSETMSTYLKRVEDLEKLASSFPGVEKCYAIQAGRELRVLVQPDAINDEQAYALARSIARKIEEDLQYPGQIRITVLRETRCVEFAK